MCPPSDVHAHPSAARMAQALSSPWSLQVRNDAVAAVRMLGSFHRRGEDTLVHGMHGR
jgi:hypothetical protein